MITPFWELFWIALTVYMEAEGETSRGKIAVAFAIVNRMQKGKLSVTDVIFSPWQFEAWGTQSIRRMKLDDIDFRGNAWNDCVKAASAAYFQYIEDLIGGRTLYMNEAVVKATNGHLPSWWKKAGEADIGVVIGSHTFRHDL